MTIRVYGKRTGESMWEEIAPVTRLDLIFDRYEPCDSLELEAAFAKPDRVYQEVFIHLDGRIIFEGKVDVQSFLQTNQGMRRLLRCRGLSAGMADNQPKPGVYFKLTPQTVFQQFAEPYGVRGIRFSSDKEQNYLVVEKGMSCWDVVDLYCRQSYRRPLCVTRDGYLKDTASEVQDVFWVSNLRSDGLRYSSLTFHRNRGEMLSRVYLKNSYETEDEDFSYSTDNGVALLENVRRERYLFPSERWYQNLSQYGKETLSRSNIHSQTLEVVLPGIRDMEIGSVVKFPEAQGSEDLEFRAYYVHLHAGEDGTYTNIKACLQYFF